MHLPLLGQWTPTIRDKVIAITLISSTLAIFVFALLVVLADFRSERASAKENLGATVRVVALNSSAALVFADVDAAVEMLNALIAETTIVDAAIFDASGKLFARSSVTEVDAHINDKDIYDYSDDIPARSWWNFARPLARWRHLHIDQAIVVGDEPIGVIMVHADLERQWAGLAQDFVYIALVASVAFLCAYILASNLQRKITEPVKALSDAVSSVTGDRDYTVRAERKTDDELGLLVDGFNDMLLQIQERDRALSRAVDELRIAKDEAETASRTKSEFLATMSHEIRTPMNGVLGMAQLMQKTKLDAQQTKFLSMIRTSGEALLAIINDVLDFSKIEAGYMAISTVDFSLAETIDDVIEIFSGSTKRKGIALSYVLPTELPLALHGDEDRIRQILVNLVSNAVKFTESGHVFIEVIDVDIRSQDVGFTVVVEDSGIGISADKLTSIFDPFQQADGSTTRQYGGTGLGLAICRQIAELMGGEITVTSTPNHGSRFLLRLRLCHATTEPGIASIIHPVHYGTALVYSDVARRRQHFANIAIRLGLDPICSHCWDEMHAIAIAMSDLRLVMIDLPDGPVQMSPDTLPHLDVNENVAVRYIAYPDQEEALSALISPADILVKPVRFQAIIDDLATALDIDPPRKPAVLTDERERPLSVRNIILAEDNVVNQVVATEMLELLGCAVTIANNGRDVLDLMLAHGDDFEMILMDIQMPIMDGIEVTKLLRTNTAGAAAKIPIVALTANALEGDEIRFLSAGMDGYLSKPFSMDQLRNTLIKHQANSHDVV